MSTRFETRYGRYGAYFFDSKNDMDLSLQEVEELLNAAEDADALVGY